MHHTGPRFVGSRLSLCTRRTGFESFLEAVGRHTWHCWKEALHRNTQHARNKPAGMSPEKLRSNIYRLLYITHFDKMKIRQSHYSINITIQLFNQSIKNVGIFMTLFDTYGMHLCNAKWQEDTEGESTWCLLMDNLGRICKGIANEEKNIQTLTIHKTIRSVSHTDSNKHS